MKTMKYRKSIDIIFTMVYGFISLINVSCDDFLSEKEVPRITSDFYKTEQGILAPVDASYAYILYSATLSPTESKLFSLWENHYKAIGVTNLVLDALPEASVSEAEKESYGAEMNFFRAYFYFDLVQQFGKIPLVTKAIQEP